MRKWVPFVIIVGAILASTAESYTTEAYDLYKIAVEAKDPEYCFSLRNPDYQMYCRVVVKDVGADCSAIVSDKIRDACDKINNP